MRPFGPSRTPRACVGRVDWRVGAADDLQAGFDLGDAEQTANFGTDATQEARGQMSVAHRRGDNRVT